MSGESLPPSTIPETPSSANPLKSVAKTLYNPNNGRNGTPRFACPEKGYATLNTNAVNAIFHFFRGLIEEQRRITMQ